MTVIAWDGDLLVADGRMCIDQSLLTDSCNKLYKLSIPKLGVCGVGFAGSLNVIYPFIEHIKEKGFEQFQTVDEPGAWGIAITRKGKCYEFNSNGTWYEMDTPTAIGSGDIICQHYLTIGFSALKAIKETCRTELSCGGLITAYDFKSGEFTTLGHVGKL